MRQRMTTALQPKVRTRMSEKKSGTFLPLLICLQMLLFVLWAVAAVFTLDSYATHADALRAGIGPQGVEPSEVWGWLEADFGTLLAGALATSLLGASLTVVIAIVAYRCIILPVERLAESAREVCAGRAATPCGIAGPSDLGEIGEAFDALLEQRNAAHTKAIREVEQIQGSVTVVLQAVTRLSEKDLTVETESREGLTKPVVEALNRLTKDLVMALRRISGIAEDVARASARVKAHSDAVFAVASAERDEVDRTATQVVAAAAAMSRIADLANSSNAALAGATKATEIALETVTATADGVIASRATLRELETRIKRLAERSQEIGGVTNLTNTIAERTHMLALNSSMHAASVGEAGRGFSVVADEVKQLAETARDVTTQITALVGNIQTETTKSVEAVNAAMVQSAGGTHFAEHAGEHMRLARQATGELVALVQEIALEMCAQAVVHNELRDRARQMQDNTRQTNLQLQQQTQQTKNLVKHTMELLGSLRAFKLPNPS